MMRIIFFTMLFAFLPTALVAQELIVGSLNTESGADTNIFSVSQTIQRAGFVDVWAFQEVENIDALVEYTVAAGAAPGRKSFRYIASESGEIGVQHRKNDLLGLVYNSSRLRQVETVELHGIRSVPGVGRLGQPDWRLRSALFLRLQDTTTGAEFYVGNVHLKCCGEGKATRALQAEIIKNWIDRSDVPVILTGDFNIPIAPTSSNGTNSDAFQTFTASMEWIRPRNPVKTQCSPNFDSMLDHFFVKSGPNLSYIDVIILEADEDYCTAEKNGGADHRPIVGRFSIN